MFLDATGAKLSRLTDLIARAKANDLRLGSDLEREFKALSSRLPFGLNFERHHPEAVELPQRPIRKGDKVRVLAERGSVEKGDRRVWLVTKVVAERTEAELQLLDAEPAPTQTVSLEDLVVVAEFQDVIYPGLVSTGKVTRGGDKPYHTVINGENYHVLKALTYTHRGKVDAIYIDPPYNTGARDWKYNNDYVEGEDLYRHSKWLAMIERRLLLAAELLNPTDSVLIVTIDEKEYLRLGLLLEQVFPEAAIQMVSSVINPKGSARSGRFSRVDEYLFFVFFGDSKVRPWRSDMLRADDGRARGVRWAGLMRNGEGSRRSRIPSMFFPVFIGSETGAFHSVGEPPAAGVSRHEIPVPDGTTSLWPIDGSGQELMWRLNPASLREYVEKGWAKFGRRSPTTGQRPILYLQQGMLDKISSGDIIVQGRDLEGAPVLVYRDSTGTRQPVTVWNSISHSASEHGSSILKALIPNRRFPYPKSLYAVEDTLRFFTKDKPSAVVLDFFSGSGTTAHAVMRLNRQDGGRRQCICVTNNEVAADEAGGAASTRLAPRRCGVGEARHLRLHNQAPGAGGHHGPDARRPTHRGRLQVHRRIPDGRWLRGERRVLHADLRNASRRELQQGFRANRAALVATRRRRSETASRSCQRAGWAVVEAYGLLTEVDRADAFCEAVNAAEGLRVAFIVTDDDRRFQAITRRLRGGVEPVRLYESYLTNFSFASGD